MVGDAGDAATARGAGRGAADRIGGGRGIAAGIGARRSWTIIGGGGLGGEAISTVRTTARTMAAWTASAPATAGAHDLPARLAILSPPTGGRTVFVESG